MRRAVFDTKVLVFAFPPTVNAKEGAANDVVPRARIAVALLKLVLQLRLEVCDALLLLLLLLLFVSLL